MVPNLRYRMWLVWAIYNAAQFCCVCEASGAAAERSAHQHPEPGVATRTRTQARRGRNSGVAGQGQQPEGPAESRQGLEGGTNGKEEELCRIRARCGQAQQAAAEREKAPMTLPALPTDPEAAPAAALRTNPSTLVPPNSHPSGSRMAGGGGPAALRQGSPMASKWSIAAGVGVSGILLLLAALLYCFQPDLLMCCPTCVRLPVFHPPLPPNN